MKWLVRLGLAVLVLWGCWRLFPRQFYTIDKLIESLVSWQLVEPNPAIDTLPELDTFIADQLDRHNVPGAAVAIVESNSAMWSKGYGYANLERSIPVTVDTAFHIGSVSKAVMGMAIVHAVEEGVLDFDTPINEILPFAVINPAAPDVPITLRHLVSHTSGVSDSAEYTRSYTLNKSAESLGDFLHSYLTPDGSRYNPNDNFTGVPPAQQVEYSNIGAGLAGYVLEQATGQPLNEYVFQHVFEPLGMRNSGYFPHEFADLDTVSQGYIRGGVPYGWVAYPTYPDGMVRASVSDVARLLFDVMEHESELLVEESVKGSGYGVFWESAESPLMRPIINKPIIGHSGSDPGATALMYHDPQTQRGVVILVNSDTRRAEEAAVNILRQILGSALLLRG